MLKYLNKINFFAFDRKSNDNNNCVCKKKNISRNQIHVIQSLYGYGLYL